MVLAGCSAQPAGAAPQCEGGWDHTQVASWGRVPNCDPGPLGAPYLPTNPSEIRGESEGRLSLQTLHATWTPSRIARQPLLSGAPSRLSMMSNAMPIPPPGASTFATRYSLLRASGPRLRPASSYIIRSCGHSHAVIHTSPCTSSAARRRTTFVVKASCAPY